MSYKILIVDDSKLARMAVSKLIIGLHPGWTRVEAANADEAIAMAADADIVLMDFNMPGRDGLEVAAQLRTLKPKMPLAIVSANHQAEIVERAHALGAAFLSKPLAKDALEQFLSSAVDRMKAGHAVTDDTTLNELELDALTELINLGVSRAASSLRGMIGEQVHLSVPSVTLISRSDAVELLGAKELRKLVAVHQLFDGDITGRVLLIFPEAKSLELVRAVTSSELTADDIIELEQEALAETGNVILNSCLATIANELQRTLKISLPEVVRGDSKSLFDLPPPPHAGEVVLFVYINFAVRHRDIQGYIALLMDLPSLVALRGLLQEYIRRSTIEPNTQGNAGA